MKDYPKARDAYEKLLSTAPNFVPALNNLAYLYAEHLNNLDKAYDLARKARELQGQDASIGDTFGWVLYKRGDYQQALPILQESAGKAADNPEIQFHLGMTAYMMGQTDLAKVALKKAATRTRCRSVSTPTSSIGIPAISFAFSSAISCDAPRLIE